MSIKGIPFIGKVKEFLWNPIYVTVQKIGHSRAALDVIHKGYYVLNPVPTVPYIAEAGSTDEFIKLTNHGFKPGDLIRLDVTVNPIDEFEIVIDSIIDADTFKLAGYLSASITTGDTFFALRPVSERFAADGSTLASLSTPPVSYNRKVAGITTQTYVLEDQDNSANNRNLPVTIKSIDGAPINITAGDLNVSINHANDSTKIGDGTTLVGVTLNNELKTRDADAITAINTLLKPADTLTKVTTLDTITNDVTVKQATGANLHVNVDNFPATQNVSITSSVEIEVTNDSGNPLAVQGTVAVSNAFATAANQTNGNQTSKLLGLAKGATAATEATVTPFDVDHNALDTIIRDFDSSLKVSGGAFKMQEVSTDAATPFSSKVIPNNAQSQSLLSDYMAKVTAAIVHGWDSTNSRHKEIALTGNGEVKTSIVNTNIAIEGNNTNAVKVRDDLNTAGFLAKNTVTNAGTTIIPPANAVGFFIKNHSNSADNLYWEIGGTANADSNDLLPGQGSAFVPVVANISLYSDTTAKYLVQWAVK